MAKVFVFLADGFEDVEALAPIDILRRGGQDVVTVSVMDGQVVQSAHGVQMVADAMFDDCDFTNAQLLVLPGGMPGATNLYNCKALQQVLLEHQKKGRLIGAICASPGVVLGQLGLLHGRRATCYPGFESMMEGAHYTAAVFTVDGNITTAEGPAAAMAFGYELLAQLAGQQTAQQIAVGMRYAHLMNW